MKIALYIEDGMEHIVLTPETPIEKQLLGRLTDSTRVVQIKRGEFYSCMGGWVRQGSSGDPSTILVIKPAGPIVA